MNINNYINDLLEQLVKTGKISKRASRKFILDILTTDKIDVDLISDLLLESKKITKCSKCNKIDFINPCSDCSQNHNGNTVSVFNSYTDILEVGHYTKEGKESNFLIGTGDKSKKQNPDDYQFEMLDKFVKERGANEIILMFDKTIKSEILADYIKSYFSSSKIKVTTLAVGISLGSSIEYLDAETIQLALKNREK